MSIAKISSLFSKNYDGGDFCKGLLFSNEVSKIMFNVGNKLMLVSSSPKSELTLSGQKENTI
jgi:hypothetical protein